MREVNIFDILGPIMIGPSSSHTAGAVRLGNMAAMIFGRPVSRVDFYLHGSFAKTYKGHGTGVALVAGLLGLSPDDERLPQAFELAKARGLEFDFHEADLGYVHPNSVRFQLRADDGEMSVVGSSLGGGTIEIVQIDQTEVSLRGDYPTIILEYPDQPGVIRRITAIISGAGVNIAGMKVNRIQKRATMVLELDSKISRATFHLFEHDSNFYNVADIGAVEESHAL